MHRGILHYAFDREIATRQEDLADPSSKRWSVDAYLRQIALAPPASSTKLVGMIKKRNKKIKGETQ